MVSSSKVEKVVCFGDAAVTSTLVRGGHCFEVALQGSIQAEVDGIGVIVEQVLGGVPGVIAVCQF